jgi:hypothetical protein
MMPPAVPIEEIGSRADEVIAEEMAIFRRAQIQTGQV